MTAAAADPHKVQLKKTRIARLLLPQIDANSALLPPDRWILKTAYEFVKDNKSFHNTMGRAAIYAGGGLGAVIAGAVAAVVLFPLALPMAAAGLAALGAAWFAVHKAKQHFEKFKEQTLPELRNEVGKKYLEYKMSEIKAAWQQKLDERRKKKAGTDAKPPEKKPEEKKPEATAPVTPKATENPQPASATEKPATTPKTGEKKSLGSAFAEMARKIAEERAKKALEKKDPPKKDAGAAPKADDKAPPPEAPKPPAPPQP